MSSYVQQRNSLKNPFRIFYILFGKASAIVVKLSQYVSLRDIFNINGKTCCQYMQKHCVHVIYWNSSSIKKQQNITVITVNAPFI